MQGLAEEVGDQGRVVGEVAAAPRTEHQRVVAVGLGGGEDLDDAGAHRAGDLRLVERSHVAGIAGGRGDERDLEGLLEQLMVVAAEDRHIGRIDHRVGAERVGLVEMERVHRTAGLAGEEGGGATVVFLLRAFAREEAAAGHGR